MYIHNVDLFINIYLLTLQEHLEVGTEFLVNSYCTKSTVKILKIFKQAKIPKIMEKIAESKAKHKGYSEFKNEQK